MKNTAPSFFLMLGFFTRLPVPKSGFTEDRLQKSMPLIPLVGLVIGAVLVLISVVLTWVGAPVLISGAVLTGCYIFLTGGLHFDGLADTCDGVFSGRSREKSLEIMRDSRIGVFGTLGIFMAGLLYFAVFTEAPAASALMVFPVCGRACCLISSSMAPYAREEGMGKFAVIHGDPRSVISAVVSVIGSSFLVLPVYALTTVLSILFTAPNISNYNWGVGLSRVFADGMFTLSVTVSLVSSAVAVLVTIFMTAMFRKKLGGVTGDTFGAVIEASSLVYMFFFIILWKVPVL